MNILQARQYLSENLKTVYEQCETAAVTDWLLEELTGLQKSERHIHKEKALTAAQESLLKKYCSELQRHRPLQYVLGYAYSMKMKFSVNENVLIPRPETEELVDWIVRSASDKNKKLHVLDIGTGSGIIPVSLKKNLPASEVFAADISGKALSVAQKNAEENHTDIHFHRADILNENEWETFSMFDIIVSNPPYIRLLEKDEMDNNVLNYEPHLALFVNDEDPLLFYKKITRFARQHLNDGGLLYFEINEAFGNETVRLLQENNFHEITLKKDFQGKDRMVKALFKK